LLQQYMTMSPIAVAFSLFALLAPARAAYVSKFQSQSNEGDPNCDYFTKVEQDEKRWDKNGLKAFVQEGNQEGEEIAEVSFQLDGVVNQHAVRLCTIDARSNQLKIHGYRFQSVGDHGGKVLILRNQPDRLTFAVITDDKNKGLRYDINVYGYKVGEGQLVPKALCINPRNINWDQVNSSDRCRAPDNQ